MVRRFEIFTEIWKSGLKSFGFGNKFFTEREVIMERL